MLQEPTRWMVSFVVFSPEQGFCLPKRSFLTRRMKGSTMMMMYDVYVCVCLHVTIRLLIKSWNDSGLFCLFDDHQNGRLVDN